ncbi:oligopeptidase B Serine peptidase. MEROPS family S09A [Quadrisphaera granulorum]|uniref:Oligopeptidase B n=1 Tax=Quadrisphaera granulorum TaxID=317664 RepID=A0A316AAN8_9ACTN|nr:oligopeptidase B [Quadrisphaera granulorum]SZE95984.1 oligopeptidase B Serine peptidase. MEROPS family S09A [Quadrisphaera granulorum]
MRVTRENHGDVVVDEHEWLRDSDDPAVRELVDAENAWTAARTAHLEPLREQLFEEVRSRTQESDLSVPSRDGAWWYYRRTVEGQQYGLICRVPAAVPAGEPGGWEPPALPEDGSALPGEQVLLDGNVEAKDSAFFALGAASVSPNGQLLAWSADITGDERFTLRVRDLVTGADLDVAIAGLGHGATWASDSRTLLYSVVDEAWRPFEVRRHLLGESAPDGTGDAVLLREDDERYWLGVGRTRSGRFIVLSAGSKNTSEVWLLDAGGPGRAPGEVPVSVAGRRDGVEYSVDHVVLPDGSAGRLGGTRDALLVLHDDDAPDFALALLDADGVLGGSATPADPATAHQRWTTVIPHEPGRRLEDVDAFAGHVAVSWRREALPRVAVLRISPDGRGSVGVGELSEPVEVPSPTALASSVLAGNPSFEAPLLRLQQTSFTTPVRVVDLDLSGGERDGELVLRRETPVRGGYDASAYVEERTWATAPDGVRVPVSVVRRADVAVDGTAPGYLYGYGSYEVSLDPWFSVPRLSLLDRGVVFAVAHVRGGGELGRLWYEGGRLASKRNTFTDFVAAAEHLGREGYVDPARLVASGGSAGGLLVGAALNLAPQLFAGVLAAVPFVDPLTTMLDESLPLTVPEQEEWGDPIRDAAAYALIKGYAPTENLPSIEDGGPGSPTWPRLLVTTSLHDTRVLYVEPFKWVARMRQQAPDGAPDVLLKTEVDGGHGGRSGRYEAWRERAFEDAWALDVLGLA